jgi:hypothetical protein
VENQQQQQPQPNLEARPRPNRIGLFALRVIRIGVLLLGISSLARGDDAVRISPTLHSFRHDMPRTVRADHPAIIPVAAAIRAVTTNPLQQLVMVNDVTHLLVDYDDDQRVYGVPEYYATLDEMIAKRRQQGWLYLRDDCDGRAVFAAHLLAALGIPWRLEASYWKHHAWVIARVGGIDYDLLDYHPGAAAPASLSYRLVGHWFVRASHQPPSFDWRRSWAEHTHHDLLTGLRLGLLALDSAPGHLHERFATDWVQQSPGDHHSPVDPRALTAAWAGFPYGEMLGAGSLVAAQTIVPINPPVAVAPTIAETPPGLAGNSSPSAR